MKANATDALQPIGAQTMNKARNEHFRIEVISPGLVGVTNHSHDDAEDHRYIVLVLGGEIKRCECPADEYNDGSCKHQLAVAIAIDDDDNDLDIETITNGDVVVVESPAENVEKELGAIERQAREVILQVEDHFDEYETETGSEPDAIADGGEIVGECPNGHDYCERGAGIDRPELCFDCWDEVAAYDEQALMEADTEAGGAGAVGTCAIGTCGNNAAEGSMRGFCEDHAVDSKLVADGGSTTEDN